MSWQSHLNQRGVQKKMSIEVTDYPDEKDEDLLEWDEIGESILRYEWLKVRYDGP